MHGRWILVGLMLDFSCLDIGFLFCGRWILVVYIYRRWTLAGWMLDFGCLYDGFWLCGRWILVVWALDYGCMDVGVWLGGRWIWVDWPLDRRQNQNVTSNRHQKHTSVQRQIWTLLQR